MLYRDLQNRYQTEQEHKDEKKKRDKKVGQYLQSRRILKMFSNKPEVKFTDGNDSLSCNSANDEGNGPGEHKSCVRRPLKRIQTEEQITERLKDEAKLMAKFRQDPQLAIEQIRDHLSTLQEEASVVDLHRKEKLQRLYERAKETKEVKKANKEARRSLKRAYQHQAKDQSELVPQRRSQSPSQDGNANSDVIQRLLGYSPSKAKQSNTSLIDQSSEKKQAFFSRILDKFNMNEDDLDISMQSYQEFEPHASYNALMELLQSEEPDRYTKKIVDESLESDFSSLGIGKLRAVKDALKYIIQEDYDENKHLVEFKSAGRDTSRIIEGSVKIRNLQRMRIFFERSHRRAE